MIEALHRILPASVSTVRDVGTITADNLLRALDEQGVGFKLVRLGLGDWETEASDVTDDEILALIHMEDAGHEGEVLICTEACSRYRLDPFRCNAAELKRFVSDYDLEMFFDGDVVIVCENTRTITVFHHVGAYIHVKV